MEPEKDERKLNDGQTITPARDLPQPTLDPSEVREVREPKPEPDVPANYKALINRPPPAPNVGQVGAPTIQQEMDDVKRRLAYLPFDESQQGASKELRQIAEAFGFQIVAKLPNSRERSLALTALEEVLTWCNKAIRAGVR